MCADTSLKVLRLNPDANLYEDLGNSPRVGTR